MPQMAPMNWFLLFNFFIFSLFMVMSKMHFMNE